MWSAGPGRKVSDLLDPEGYVRVCRVAVPRRAPVLVAIDEKNKRQIPLFAVAGRQASDGY